MTRTIAIVDNDDAIRRSTATLVESAGYRVEVFASGDAFLAAQPPQCPDCVVLDMHMPGVGDLDVLGALATRDDPPVALVASGLGDVSHAVKAMKLGAADFLERPYPPAALLAAIDRACALRDLMRRATEAKRQAAVRLEPLSKRQRQILGGVVRGRPNKIMAYELGLSVRTVEAYRAQMLERIGARSTAEAVQIGLAAGVL
jgi:two-component system response regulator FixJ